jgi:hypothetical protein
MVPDDCLKQSVEGLSKIVRIKLPLFTLLKEPRPGEVEMVLEHASLAVMVNS